MIPAMSACKTDVIGIPLYLGANSLIITVFGEEEQPGDGCEHALELVDRAAIAAAFPAEHPPCLHLCHGVLDGGADLAEDRVEFTLPVQEFRSAEALEWHDPDAVDSYVAEVGASIACGHGFLKCFLEAGGLERNTSDFRCLGHSGVLPVLCSPPASESVFALV